MTDYKYEAYFDGNLIRIKPCNAGKTGKVYGQPNNVFDFVATKTAEYVVRLKKNEINSPEDIFDYTDIRIKNEVLNAKIRIRKKGEEPRLVIFKDEYYNRLGGYLTHSLGLKTRDEETIDSKVNR
ncbi:hypothetical protein JXB27_00510 [Candidatus Woesearchaeota archaeon]|nr:hypothetical protein [Candidatus Woesearchaeota archaeon]